MSDENPIKRKDVATPADVRRNLALTDEKVTVLQKDQNKLLKLFHSRARLTLAERKVARGIELERHHRKTGNKNALAEALAAQGRYNEAADTAENKDLRKNLQEKAAAVRGSETDCACDTYYQSEGVLLPNQHVESVDAARNKVFMRCRVCGKLVHGAILPHLANQRDQRRASEKGQEIKANTFFQKV